MQYCILRSLFAFLQFAVRLTLDAGACIQV
jgi:hypothetical protein